MRAESSEAIFVLDSSFTIAWVLGEEGEEEHVDNVLSLLISIPNRDVYRTTSNAFDSNENRYNQNTAVIPSLWFYEVANVLAISSRKGRLSQKDLTRAIALLQALPIVVDSDCESRTSGEILALAREHTLTVYDATYLDLAMRTSLPLATLDNPLIQASQSLGVTIL